MGMGTFREGKIQSWKYLGKQKLLSVRSRSWHFQFQGYNTHENRESGKDMNA